ncbi:MAG: FkbM family methyltransferase [Ignavibacteriae bacterium]|nr:FkbM family methyltransferase [Ignavibacteriota bacterium]
MIDLKSFNFGPLKDDLIRTLTKEFQDKNPYGDFYKVKEGDIVVDCGASNGIFTYSILDNKPKHVFCLEPSKALFPYLVKNTMGYPVTQINKAITKGDGIIDDGGNVYADEGSYEMMKWKTFINRFGIDKIDYLKLDCEGGEYDIFTDSNIDWILNNVGCIVGEFHLGDAILKEKFKHFRDNYIDKFKHVEVYSVDGVNIKWNMRNGMIDKSNTAFMDRYEEVIIHLSNG